MASRKTWIAAAVVGIAAVGGVVAWAATRDSRGRVVVQTQKVGRRDLVSIVSASGEVKPEVYVDVSANVSGRIVNLLVKEGDTVKKGQVLARIESTRFEAGLQQSEAAVAGARADLARAQADLDLSRQALERTRRMHEEKLVADQAFEQADADVRMKVAVLDSQRRRIGQQSAMLASSRDDLEKTVVPAPMDGVVTALQKEQGEVVIGAQSFAPTVIMTVANLSVMQVEVLVDETDIHSVALGQPADVRVDAFEGVKVTGKVTEIGSSAIPRGGNTGAASSSSGGSQAKDFKVTVTLEHPPANLRPGLNATADITTARKEKVIAIPIQAVVVRQVDEAGKVIDPDQPDQGGGGNSTESVKPRGQEKDGVFAVKDGVVHFHPVKTGILGETDIEILSGLAEGDEIVTGSYKTLRTLKDEARIKLETKKP